MSETFSVEYSVTENGRKAPQYRIGTDLNGEVSLEEFLEFTKATLILTADQALTEEQDKGFDKHPVVAVDNRVGKRVIDVKPLGSIEFTARAQAKEVLLAAYEAILVRSPEVTGEYVSSHRVFLNKVEIAKTYADLVQYFQNPPELGDDDVFRIVNIAPYARKLERLGVTVARQQARTGKNKKTGKTFGIPNGTYFLATRAIRRLFKRNSVIRFEFVTGTQIGVVGGGFKSGKGAGRPYLYPSMLISVKESGVAS